MLKKPLAISTLLCACYFNGCIQAPKKSTTNNISPENPIQSDWLYWRGPQGSGVSKQTGLPVDLNQSLLWTHDIQGGGVPVIAGGKAYQFGYYGTTDDLQEALVCFDAS